MDLSIHIGTHICEKCYELSPEILAEYNIFSKEKGYLPMKDILIDNLIKIGIRADQITSSPHCTRCTKDNNGDPLYFSYRNNQDPRRILSFIALR